MARTLAKNLGRAGYEVEHAPHGEAALARLGTVNFDVVLTDLKMPVMDGMDLLRAMHERGDSTTGPTNLETRYVLEDVPFGLVSTEKLGRLVGAPAVLHESGTNLMSAIYGRDFRAENDLLPEIGFDRLSFEELKSLCREGYPPARTSA